MIKIQSKPKSNYTNLKIQKRRSYQDTLNNLAHYLEQNKKK